MTETTAGPPGSFARTLAAYRPRFDAEAADVRRVATLLASTDPWDRGGPLHVTGSALVVHPPSRRVLLRWHRRQRGWLQVGGHADPGEVDALTVALREAREETGLADLVPWPDATIIHLTIVAVAASGDEPAHEHADVRYLLATERPERATPEDSASPLRWWTVGQAMAAVGEDNVAETLRRAGRLLTTPGR